MNSNQFNSEQTFSIHADGSIIRLVDANAYNKTIGFQSTWTWRQLNDFLLHDNTKNAVLFSTAWDDEWILQVFINQQSYRSGIRSFESYIEVTDRCLYLVNWTDITFTLQFEDESLPSDINNDLRISLPNGHYRVIVKQLFDNEDEDYSAEDSVSYIIELLIIDQPLNVTNSKLYWTDDFPNDDSIFRSNETNDFDDLLDHLIHQNFASLN